MTAKLLACASAALMAFVGLARAEEVVLRAVNAFPEGKDAECAVLGG